MDSLWDEASLESENEIAKFNQWANPLQVPETDSTTTGTAADELGDPATENKPDSSTSTGNPEVLGSKDRHNSTIDERIFVPPEEHCGSWRDSPNKERHASFGDGGTTHSQRHLFWPTHENEPISWRG